MEPVFYVVGLGAEVMKSQGLSARAHMPCPSMAASVNPSARFGTKPGGGGRLAREQRPYCLNRLNSFIPNFSFFFQIIF
jgi:hypothetical protein